MSLFWLIVSLLSGSISLFFAIRGAIKSKEGWLGRMAYLSVPIFYSAVIGALSIPNDSGYTACEFFALLGVVASAALVLITNHYHNKMLSEKLNKRLNNGQG